MPERAYSTCWHSGGLWQWWLVWRLSQIRDVLMTHTYIYIGVINTDILLFWYLILYPWKHGYSHQNYFDIMCSNWNVDKNAYFCNGGRYLLIQRKVLVWNSYKWLNLILWPSNIRIDTKIILIQCIVTEILTKTRFSVMAALFCILRRLPKDDRVASFRFLKNTYQRYGNGKKSLYGPNCKAG
jgi:hypothetical protein